MSAPAASAAMLGEVLAIYKGSDGDATRRLYARLEEIGVEGIVALNLFRACKASERAKTYSRKWKGTAYEKKHWSMSNLCDALGRHADACDIEAWGWGRDAEAVGYEHVLYVDLPTGQVSFHSDVRLKGPDYGKAWDGARGAGAARIIRWCAALLDLERVPA